MNFSSAVFYAGLMLLAGVGIPIMAALNGNLGTRLQSPLLATAILFTVGSVVSVIYLLIAEGRPKFSLTENVPGYLYFAGLFVIFYILSITWVGPKFGIGNAVAFVLLGQLISMTVIDHLGLFGAPQNMISVQRLIGLSLMIVGVFLVVRRF